MVVIEGEIVGIDYNNLPPSFISDHVNFLSDLFIRMYCCVYGNLICQMYQFKEKIAEYSSIEDTISHVVEASREEGFCIWGDGENTGRVIYVVSVIDNDMRNEIHQLSFLCI